PSPPRPRRRSRPVLRAPTRRAPPDPAARAPAAETMTQRPAADVTASPLDQGRVGVGLRWEHLEDVLAALGSSGRVEGVDHFEICPENYARRGGYIPEALEVVRAKVPVLCHGLTLDVGGLAPLDGAFLGELRGFLRHVHAPF